MPIVKANLHSSPKLQLTREEVEAQLMTFVFAGWGTVLSVQAQLLRQLVLHPLIQGQLRTELLSLGERPSVEAISSARFLDAVIKEAVRIADFAPLERVASRDDVIPLSRPMRLVNGTEIKSLCVKKGQAFV